MINGIGMTDNLNINTRSTQKTDSTQGVNFLGAVTEAVRAGEIVMPQGVEYGKLNFTKEKFAFDKPLNEEQILEETVEDIFSRIKQILGEKNL